MKYALPVLLLTSTLAHADPMTVGDCIGIFNGLNQLDHTTDASGKTAPTHFKFDSGIRFALARDMAALAPVAEAAQKAWNQTLSELGKPFVPNAPDTLKFQNSYQAEVLDKPCKARLEHFPLANLRPGDGKDENDISPGTLALLLLLDEVVPVK
jgi:hypothetical protein